jgi:glycine reductase
MSIKKAVEQCGKDGVVVMLGAPDADSAELYGETVVHGDPSWGGPLAGVAMELPVFHIMEPEIKAQIDPKVYEEHLGLMEVALEVEKITQGLNRVRLGKKG